MARRGIVTGTTALLAAVALGVAGCGAAEVASEPAREAAVEVAAAMGVEGQALAAMGFDADDLDVRPSPRRPRSTPGASPQRRGRRPSGRARRGVAQAAPGPGAAAQNTLHGEAVVQTKDGGTKTVAVQRGEVTAIDGDSMTVKSTDGFTMTWTFGDEPAGGRAAGHRPGRATSRSARRSAWPAPRTATPASPG